MSIPVARSIYAIGDPHCGFTPAENLGIMAADIAAADLASRAAVTLVVGDCAHEGWVSDDNDAMLAFLGDAGLSGAKLLHGNHDAYTIGDFNATYGLDPVTNWTVDTGYVRLIALNPEDTRGHALGPITLSPETLTFLDERLAETSLPCVVAAHAPLSLNNGATNDFGCTHPIAEIDAVLAAHSNARIWLSGHTHARTHNSFAVQRRRIAAGRSVICINASALFEAAAPTNPEQWDTIDIRSIYVTVFDEYCEVRFRDHRTEAASLGYQGQAVIRMAYDERVGAPISYSAIPPCPSGDCNHGIRVI